MAAATSEDAGASLVGPVEWTSELIEQSESANIAHQRAEYEQYAERRRRRVEERDAERLTESERARRARIGEANKGRVPWNKGRKHRPGGCTDMSQERTWHRMSWAPWVQN